MVSGIYEIINKETNKKYIGQSVNVQSRLSQHRSRSSNRFIRRMFSLQRRRKIPIVKTNIPIVVENATEYSKRDLHHILDVLECIYINNHDYDELYNLKHEYIDSDYKFDKYEGYGDNTSQEEIQRLTRRITYLESQNDSLFNGIEYWFNQKNNNDYTLKEFEKVIYDLTYENQWLRNMITEYQLKTTKYSMTKSDLELTAKILTENKMKIFKGD